ncbi:hypothetical protein BaRGS_00011378, partial [Batillaria attramentaria]
ESSIGIGLRTKKEFRWNWYSNIEFHWNWASNKERVPLGLGFEHRKRSTGTGLRSELRSKKEFHYNWESNKERVPLELGFEQRKSSSETGF